MEAYRYSMPGKRLRKSAAQDSSPSRLHQQTLYLPGMEKRLIQHKDCTSESFIVMMLNTARVYCGLQDKSARVRDPLIRYAAPDRNGSCRLETDQTGAIISCETFYPYGGSALWRARSKKDASYKYWRYVSKERDITGLIYYGFRYYLVWLMRWLNPDPAGEIDGLNLVAMVGNNPVTFSDVDGRVRTVGAAVFITAMEASKMKVSDEDTANHREAISKVFLQTNFTGDVADLIQQATFETPSKKRIHLCFHAGCNAQFTNSALYDQHLTEAGWREHDEKLWSCHWINCGALFRQPFRLRNHLKAHEKKREVPCKVEGCTASFNTIQVMYKHVKRRHPGTAAFLCTVENCAQRFDTPLKLRKHVLMQHKPEVYICEKCPTEKTFVNKYNLNLHLKKHEENWVMHRCAFPGCGKEYSQSQSLLRHQKLHHGMTG